MLHDLSQLDLKPEAAGFAAVIYGHSHKPAQETKDGVLYFNPGSAGPRRFDLPISVGRLKIVGKEIFAEIIELRRIQDVNSDSLKADIENKSRNRDDGEGNGQPPFTTLLSSQ